MKDALSKTKPSAAKAKSSAARLQRVRDLRLVVCLLLTAAVGLCVLLLGGPAEGAEGFRPSEGESLFPRRKSDQNAA